MFTQRRNRYVYSLISFTLALVVLFWLANTLRAAPNGDYALEFANNSYVRLGGAGVTEDQVFGSLNPPTRTWPITKSISLWIRPMGPPSSGGDIGLLEHIAGNNPRWFGISRGVLLPQPGQPDRIWIWNTWANPTPQSSVIGIEYQVGEWMHVALVHDSTTLYAYKNGVLVGTTATGPTYLPNPGATNRWLGFGGTRLDRNNFRGQVDEVSFWRVALTQEEIRQWMYRGLDSSHPSWAGLSAYYELSDGSGTTVTDNGPAGFTGNFFTNNTNPAWVASGAFTGPRMALDFDGVDDYVDVGSDGNTVIGGGWAGTKSAEVWVRPTATGIVTDTAVQGDLIVGGAQWGISQATIGGDDRLWLWNNDGDEDRIGLPYTPGEWTHVSLVHSGGTLTAYQDGRAAGSIASGNTISDTVLTIGGRSGGSHFQGQLDELRLWNTARTAGQILANAYQTVSSGESGLAAYYRFDQQNEVGQTEVVDSTGNDHHATMTNMAPNADWLLSTTFNTWIGGDSQAWSSGGNWSRYAPTDTRLGITRYPNSYSATVTTTTTILDAVMSPDADLVVDDTLTISNRLLGPGHVTVNGDLFNLGNMDVATVTVTSGALLRVESGGALTVTGLLQNNGTLSQTQPVSGSVASFFNTGAYGGVQIDSNGQNLGETAVSIRGNQNCTSTPNETVRRCFDITPELTPTIGVSITFAFADGEIPLLLDCDTLNVYHWNGSTWDVITPTVRNCSASLNLVTVENVTDFSPFVLRSPNSPTAITLHSFSVTTGVDATMALPILVFLLTITGSVLWRYLRRRAQSVHRRSDNVTNFSPPL